MPVRNLFVIALAAIISMTCYSTASRSRYANLFAEAMTTIEQEALQDIPRNELFSHAMNGMTTQLDGHSVYISGEMYRLFKEDLEQEFGGVGMYVDTDPSTGELTVLSPIPGTPAFESGIRAGDVIVTIAGKSTKDLERGEAIELIRGPCGESVEVLVARDGERILHRLVRAVIHEPSVHGDFREADGSWNYYLKDYPRLGYIRLLHFGSKSSQEMEEAIKQIADEVDALIVDLRNNSGGLLDSAIEISDLFLEPGKSIVSTRGRKNVLLEEHFSRNIPIFPRDKPLIVLVNRESASASEVVAACLQDHERAVVIGETTWGKGTVQHVIPIERNKSALKLTTASYWRPSGVNIDRYGDLARKTGVWGVQPNAGMHVELTPEEIFENRRLRSLLDLRGLVDTAELIERNDQEMSKAVDEPLQRAIEFLMDKLENRVPA